MFINPGYFMHRLSEVHFFTILEVRGFEPLTYCVQGSCSPS